MRGLPVIQLAIVVALSVGAQAQAPGKGKVVDVEIIFAADLKVYLEMCKTGKLPPTTVLVSGKEVRHCVDGQLLDHETGEKETPGLFSKTVVRLSAGDSIRWTTKSKNTFRVVQVRKHAPVQGRTPAYPFTEPLPETFSSSVTVGQLIDLDGAVEQQYKVTFEVDKPGNRIDPDLVCSM